MFIAVSEKVCTQQTNRDPIMILEENLTSTFGSMAFMARNPLHITEKAYRIRYEPHGDIPATNTEEVRKDDITVHDFRSSMDKLDLETDGFVVQSLVSKMRLEDYADPAAVQKIYLAEVRLLLQNMFSTENVAVLEYLVRWHCPNHVTGKVSLPTGYRYVGVRRALKPNPSSPSQQRTHILVSRSFRKDRSLV